MGWGVRFNLRIVRLWCVDGGLSFGQIVFVGSEDSCGFSCEIGTILVIGLVSLVSFLGHCVAIWSCVSDRDVSCDSRKRGLS